jgi:RNA polymerase sigma-70 factor (ECF subfamily)
MDDDIGGLDAFCHGVHPALVGSLTLYVGDRELARELAQETLARVCQHWSRVQRMDAPQAWAHRVAMNLANSWFRRRKAERAAVARMGGLRQSDDTGETGDGRHRGDVLAVRAAVAALPKRQRAALILRYYRDLSVEQAAAELGCRPGTVKALTSQAIASLRLAGLDGAALLPAEQPGREPGHRPGREPAPEAVRPTSEEAPDVA